MEKYPSGLEKGFAPRLLQISLRLVRQRESDRRASRQLTRHDSRALTKDWPRKRGRQIVQREAVQVGQKRHSAACCLAQAGTLTGNDELTRITRNVIVGADDTQLRLPGN